jgi:superfamily II RNA helicase
MAKGDARNRRQPRGGTQGPSNIKKLVKYCHENNFLPLIVFSFSKKDVEGKISRTIFECLALNARK